MNESTAAVVSSAVACFADFRFEVAMISHGVCPVAVGGRALTIHDLNVPGNSLLRGSWRAA